jgi:VWFA-related protein
MLAGLWVGTLQPPTAPLAAQSAPEPTGQNPPVVIKEETNLVLVDVIATDKKGNYLTDLEQKDFRVYEDDAERTISSFSRESDAGSNAPVHQRYMVLFFDDSTMNAGLQAQARAAAVKFVESAASPNRLMAVVDFGGNLKVEQNFTANTDLLKSAISGAKFGPLNVNVGGGSTSPYLRGLQSDFTARNGMLALREIAKTLRPIPGRKTMILFSAGFPLTLDRQPELNATVDALNKANVAVYPVDVRGLVGGAPGSPRSEIRAPESPFPHLPGLLAALAVPGAPEPQVIGPNALPNTRGHVGPPSVTGTSNRSADLHALPRFPSSVSTNQQVLYALAKGTGGFEIFNTNDFLAGLEKVSKEMSEYYNLGYTPPNQSHDGSYHKITVKVGRPGVVLRYRTGYYDLKSPDLLQGKPEGKALEAHATDSETGEIPVAASVPYFYTEPGVARVNLALSIPASAINFEKQKGAFHSDVNVLGIAYAENGAVAARFSDTVKLDYDKKDLKDLGPFAYQNTFNIAPGSYTLKLVLSAGGAKFGKYVIPLVVQPFSGKDLTLGGPALGDKYVPVAQATVNMDQDLMEERTPLVFKGMQLVPSATNRFPKGAQPMVYLEIYDPALKTSSPPRVGIVFSILERKSQQMLFSSNLILINDPSQPGNPLVPFGFRLPVERLPAGDYRLVVKGSDETGSESSLRGADFSIE